MYARNVMVLFGAVAMFMTMQGCGEPPKAKDGTTTTATQTAADKGKAAGAAAASPTAGTTGPSPTAAKAGVASTRMMSTSGPAATAQLTAAKMHHDAAKMQLEAAKLQHQAAAATSGMPLPSVSKGYNYLDDIPYDSPMPHESYKYLDSAPLPKRGYRDTLSSSKLGAPPSAPSYKASYKPYGSQSSHYLNKPKPKPIRPMRSYAARKEAPPVTDGSHYTSVQISAPAGTDMKSTVTDNGNGNVQATQYNYNTAANGATTNVQSGPPHTEHNVDVVQANKYGSGKRYM